MMTVEEEELRHLRDENDKLKAKLKDWKELVDYYNNSILEPKKVKGKKQKVSFKLKKKTIKCLETIAYLNSLSLEETITSLIWTQYKTYHSLWPLDVRLIAELQGDTSKISK